MIDTTPFSEKLEKLREYMDYFINTTPMVLPHKFHTYPPAVRDYFIDAFTRHGFDITGDRLILRRKTFDQWLLLN